MSLHQALRNSDAPAAEKALVRMMREFGRDQCAIPRIRDIDGMSVVHYVCNAKVVNYTLLKLLVDFGADLERCDSEGFTPLARAIKRNNTELARALLQLGAAATGCFKCGSA